ncbi:MAG: rhodanese-like domain-containing protein [Burkholderiales bacterium]|nr:rhodanese-like domain-containing protein [Burkholderiales bacterium]
MRFPSHAGLTARDAAAAPSVSARDLHAMLTDGHELALLDVRETGVHVRGHIFHAASLPLSTLELSIEQALPCMATRIVLVDDEDGLAAAASRRLSRMGYRNVAVLGGGQAGWRAAGFAEYSGLHVPSKAFGEVVEHAYGTPSITAEELEARRASGDVLVLDSRSEEEFHAMSLPGAASCPGGELVARALRHEGLLVVNCAGRTRSIMGAQSLISAGKHEVRALRNGLMGQRLAGLPCHHGRRDTHADRPVAAGAAQAAARLASALDIAVIGSERVNALLADTTRTCYLFDVRLPGAWRAGTLPGAINTPGGQLVQQTDACAPVRNARVIVFDTDAVQAPMTAFWLSQMGWEVYVHRAPADSLAPPRPAAPAAADDEGTQLPLAPAVRVIDVGDSRQYRARHLPGAAWTVRSRLAQTLAGMPAGASLVFTCADGRLSALAAADARALGHDATHLRGGVQSVGAAGLTADDPRYLTTVDDVWYRPYDRDTGVEEAMREYLSWETGLLARVMADPTVPFRHEAILAMAGLDQET